MLNPLSQQNKQFQSRFMVHNRFVNGIKPLTRQNHRLVEGIISPLCNNSSRCRVEVESLLGMEMESWLRMDEMSLFGIEVVAFRDSKFNSSFTTNGSRLCCESVDESTITINETKVEKNSSSALDTAGAMIQHIHGYGNDSKHYSSHRKPIQT